MYIPISHIISFRSREVYLRHEIAFYRSSHRRCYIKKLFLKISQYSQGNTCAGISFVGLRACNFIKNRLQHRFFPVNIANFLRIPILKNICERLLLVLIGSNSLTENRNKSASIVSVP